MNLWIVFLTGLTTGGLSCLAVQGGLLVSLIANLDQKRIDIDQSSSNLRKKFSIFNSQFSISMELVPLTFFLVAKLISHTILGFLLGLLGSALTLSDGDALFFQGFAALFMFATAMNLLNVHPIFRYVALQPPKFISKRIRGLSKQDGAYAPFLLGLMTVFIPCGVTQAMEVNAIAVANPIQSSALMFAFVLGTVPLFSIIGVAMAKLSEGLTKKFLRFVAIVLIGMSLYSLNGILEVTDAPVSGHKIANAWISFWTPDPVKRSRGVTETMGGRQQVTIEIKNQGYVPNIVRVKRGIPVDLNLKSNGVYSCALAFRLPAFGIKEFLNATDSKTVTFTPQKSGRYTFTCSMGMYTGVLEVI